MRRLHLAALIFLSTLIAGCGFQLRGSHELPPDLSPIYVQSGSEDLQASIMQVLETSGVALVEDQGQARSLLRVLGERRSNRTLSVDSRGKVVEYEMHYLVEFDAVDAKGESLFDKQQVNLVRTLRDADIEVLGKQEEADLLNADMAREMADRIVYRLRARVK